MEKDMSFSMIFDNKNVKDDLTKIQSRQRSTWIDTKYTSNCFKCKIPFSIYIRTHHCRKCGNVFCYKCSDNFIQIVDTKDAPKVRVCIDCTTELNQIKSIDDLFSIFNHVPISIKEYRIMRLVSKRWNKLANFYLSKLRELQYKLPYQEFNKLEHHLLVNNAKYFYGHSVWENIYYNAGYIFNTQTTNYVNCKELMCSRICKKTLQSYEIISIINGIKDVNLLKSLFKSIDSIHPTEFNNYILYLLEQIRTHSLKKYIAKFVIKQASKDYYNSAFLYIIININLSTLPKTEITIFKQMLNTLLSKLSKDNINYINNTDSIISFLNDLPKDGSLNDIQKLFKQHLHLFINKPVPIEPKLICTNVIIDNIKIKNSSTKPILIPLQVINTEGVESVYYMMYKFEDIRQDQIIMNTIRTMEVIINNELSIYNTKTPKILSFNIFPTSIKSGLIEIIPQCYTLYEIEKKYTILNYIIEHNKNIPIDNIRQTFLQSAAAYSVITYLLGVGDRHLDNIMITEKGYLFHIDYGFILGKEPKPVRYPSMRITKDMVDTLGGQDSIYYTEFIQLVKDIHLCLQKRLGIIYCLLRSLIGISNKYNNNDLLNHLLTKFMYGENYEQTGKQLYIHITNSSDSYTQAFIDFFHYHQKEKTIPTIINSTLEWINNFTKSSY
jgi:hypothetical protein